MNIAWLWVLVLLICAVLISWAPRSNPVSIFFAVLAAIIAGRLLG